MSIFGKSRAEKERDIRELTQLGRNVPISKVISILISKHEHRSNPHSDPGRELGKKTEEIIQELQKNKIKDLPIDVHFSNNHHLFLSNENATVKLRALRSTGRRDVHLNIIK